MPVDSGWPASRFAALLDRGALQNQNQLDADLQGWLSEEHKANGEHGDIVADSITLNPANPADALTGKVIVQDEDEKQTQFYRTRALETLFDLIRGNYITIRNQNYQGTLTNLVRLGFIQHGAATDPAIKLFSQGATFDDWAFFSGTGASSSPALIIGNGTTGIDPIALRYRSGVPAYEWMKHVGGAGPTTEQVTLGSGLDSSLQGYWDAAYIKSLNLQTVANSHAVAGAWTDVAFNAGNFTAGGAQTWTLGSGDQTTFAYMLLGNTMTLTFVLSGTSVGGTPDVELRIAIPASYTATHTVETVGWATDNGTVTIPRLQVAAGGGTYVSVFNQLGTNWAASTDNTAVYGQITFPIA